MIIDSFRNYLMRLFECREKEKRYKYQNKNYKYKIADNPKSHSGKRLSIGTT